MTAQRKTPRRIKRPMAEPEVDFEVHRKAAILRTEQQIKEAVRNELKSPDFIEAVAMAMVQASSDILGGKNHVPTPSPSGSSNPDVNAVNPPKITTRYAPDLAREGRVNEIRQAVDEYSERIADLLRGL